MAEFQKFNFKTLDEISAKIEELGANIPLSCDFEVLKQPLKVGNKVAPNRFAVLPMEGCDSNPDGSPSELVQRRYNRFAAGGAGLLWWEACAVVPEGKANPLQMMLTDENKETFKKMVDEANAEAKKYNGDDFVPVNVLQLTHSGRYSRPIDAPAPLVPQNDPLLDPRVGRSENDPVVTDEYIESLTEKYVHSALLAKEVGFDGVDIKACHRYLVSELLASHTRDGKYGGSFENRVRFLIDTIKAVREAVGDDFIVASRFNVYDAHPYPYGFGVDKDDVEKYDFTEPEMLVKLMVEAGVDLLSSSAGNPYFRFPNVTRPFDMPVIGAEMPTEHPLESANRLFELTEKIQAAAGDIPVIGNGYSWLRQFIPHIGAANLAAGRCSFIGLGRSSFAYPDAPREVITNGEMNPAKCCIACSKCTQIMRDHGRTGCVIRDSEVYLPLFKDARESAH
ncbi:MAG: NADH:flavin oxidoreductase [Clostridia bacterium]